MPSRLNPSAYSLPSVIRVDNRDGSAGLPCGVVRHWRELSKRLETRVSADGPSVPQETSEIVSWLLFLVANGISRYFRYLGKRMSVLLTSTNESQVNTRGSTQ
ncbi:hypothetical protein LMH87_007121 [Akanthomyces muscarius]|uniref:Uncharacterized protein n=1 Tax=Akanthomyces muscarius TaxID=2231603 RepID=A0A9W8US46_AKAMU|nr:hypothetical protein LMH87_007121 [Akanthomyces muscarius]KAJ4165491.1 hypothetical protein LMH87_007121 [Akanthomyces muscarius]